MAPLVVVLSTDAEKFSFFTPGPEFKLWPSERGERETEKKQGRRRRISVEGGKTVKCTKVYHYYETAATARAGEESWRANIAFLSLTFSLLRLFWAQRKCQQKKRNRKRCSSVLRNLEGHNIHCLSKAKIPPKHFISL